ncbi:MAG: hypothetical protein AB8B71_07185 [Paracoccaceae bacterium]
MDFGLFVSDMFWLSVFIVCLVVASIFILDFKGRHATPEDLPEDVKQADLERLIRADLREIVSQGHQAIQDARVPKNT